MSEINLVNEYYKNVIYFKDKTNNVEKPNYFIKFLSVYYNIRNIDDCINWCKQNINLQRTTINRILDIVWEVIIKPEHFETDDIIDKIITLYIYIYKMKYNKDIDYHIMDKVLRNDGKKLLNTHLIYYSNKSYQKEIKKSLYNNIK
jgi:K+/H+ antiporter YhaU regulatory subunit KhtT